MSEILMHMSVCVYLGNHKAHHKSIKKYLGINNRYTHVYVFLANKKVIIYRTIIVLRTTE